MDIGSNDYRLAAVEHLEAAVLCFENKRWLTSHYLSGLAVECILRAHRYKSNAEFDGRHNIEQLLAESGLLARINGNHSTNVQGYIKTIGNRWRNDHRYASRAKLEDFLEQQGGPKSLQKSTAQMLTAVQFVVQLGIQSY